MHSNREALTAVAARVRRPAVEAIAVGACVERTRLLCHSVTAALGRQLRGVSSSAQAAACDSPSERLLGSAWRHCCALSTAPVHTAVAAACRFCALARVWAGVRVCVCTDRRVCLHTGERGRVDRMRLGVVVLVTWGECVCVCRSSRPLSLLALAARRERVALDNAAATSRYPSRYQPLPGTRAQTVHTADGSLVGPDQLDQSGVYGRAQAECDTTCGDCPCRARDTAGTRLKAARGRRARGEVTGTRRAV